MSRLWSAIPNFVDCRIFRPAGGMEARRRVRLQFGIPEEAFVIGCVAAVKKDHKRIDYLVREIGEAEGCRLKAEGGEGRVAGGRWEVEGRGKERTPNAQHPTSNAQVTGLAKEAVGCGLSAEGEGQGREGTPNIQHPTSNAQLSVKPQSATSNPCLPLFLLLAGARTGETLELQEMAERLLPGRHRMLLDCPREQMPGVYRAMDVFVLPSLFEMMPIALLEAMASGLPCLVNRHPVLEWMVGEETADRRLQTEDRRPQTIDKEGKEGARVGGGRWTGEENPGLETDFCISINTQPSTLNHSPLSAGLAIDMSRDGELAAALADLTPEWIARHGSAARQRAERLFEKNVVIGQYVEYYRHVTGEK